MYLVMFDLVEKIKKKIGTGAIYGEGCPEKQFTMPWPIAVDTSSL